ncbi:hypothetical protein ACJX0J_029733 [Zea mays]
MVTFFLSVLLEKLFMPLAEQPRTIKANTGIEVLCIGHLKAIVTTIQIFNGGNKCFPPQNLFLRICRVYNNAHEFYHLFYSQADEDYFYNDLGGILLLPGAGNRMFPP